MTDALIQPFPPAEVHAPHATVTQLWVENAKTAHAQGQPYAMPLTNAAAIFAAVANLDPKGPCRFRPLRVSNVAQTQWDPTPVAAYGAPGTTQLRDGVPGLLWPIYSRDMPVAKSCLQFLVALATGKPTPMLPIPKQVSGLYEALRLGVVGPSSAGPVDPHAVAQGATTALVWVQRINDELVDGEPVQPSPPQFIAVNLAVSLPDLCKDPASNIRAPEDLQDLVACIVERLSKLRMRGRRAGEAPPTKVSPTAGDNPFVKELRERAERAEAKVLAAEQQLEGQARIYAEQLQAMAGGVPVEVAAGYFTTMLGYLRNDAPFNDLAARIRTEQPALFAAIATRMQGGGHG